MCPLRIILVFLSAILAGIFVLKNLNLKSPSPTTDVPEYALPDSPTPPPPSSKDKKEMSLIGSGFWTFVDMATGRYLWRHLATAANRSH